MSSGSGTPRKRARGVPPPEYDASILNEAQVVYRLGLAAMSNRCSPVPCQKCLSRLAHGVIDHVCGLDPVLRPSVSSAVTRRLLASGYILDPEQRAAVRPVVALRQAAEAAHEANPTSAETIAAKASLSAACSSGLRAIGFGAGSQTRARVGTASTPARAPATSSSASSIEIV
ncbi:hypothetical protein EDB80DRAFT_865781 [Ilyonectria destructans]|nr:hypothetical protein EDB80DRAFT_865781 [Ilyonectria destructans]